MPLKTSPLAKFIRTDVRIYRLVFLFFILHSSTFFPCFIIAIGIDFTTDKIEWLDSWRFVSNYSRVLKIKISTTGLEWCESVSVTRRHVGKREERGFLTRLSFSLIFFPFPYVALNHRAMFVAREVIAMSSIFEICSASLGRSMKLNIIPEFVVRLVNWLVRSSRNSNTLLLFFLDSRTIALPPPLLPHPALCSSMLVVRASRGRSFPPRFSRYRNWFIGGQSMNNSNRTIHSPINLGPKAAWHTTRSLGEKLTRTGWNEKGH